MPDDKIPSLTISIDAIVNIARTGARRAAAFRAIGKSHLPPGDLTDFSLGIVTKTNFWPNPVDPKVAESAAVEFDAWLLGACLREVHLHFEIFLNTLWEPIKMVASHGATIPSDYVYHDKKFRDVTSVSQKYETICEALQFDTGAKLNLQAFHKLRNCLSHGAGYLRQRDCSDGTRLVVGWTGLDTWLQDGDEKIQISDAIDTEYRIQSPEGANVCIQTVPREKFFELGKKVSLTENELGEICMYYCEQAGLLTGEFARQAKKQGILFGKGAETY